MGRTEAVFDVKNEIPVKCEADPAHAFLVDAMGARHLALFSRESGAVLIHISTDYVFNGALQRPYVETDLPCPRRSASAM